MKRELWNLMVLMIAPILLTLAWTLQASDETPPNEPLKAARDLLLRPVDKADYYVRDLLLRPEDTLTTRYIDPRLKPHPLQLEKPK